MIAAARRARTFAAGLVALLLLQSAAPSAAQTSNATLRVALATEPNSLNPLLATNDYEQFVDRLIFDVLVSAAPGGRTFVPRLAREVPTLENGGISKDGLTITYHLRRGVRWHDGAPFTSKDVAFSLAAIMNPANNIPGRHGYELIRSAQTPDPYTIVFHMKQRFAPAIATLFSDGTPNPILPEHLLAKYPNLNAVPFNTAPIGTGPFKFVRWDHGSQIELAANDDYYLGKPKSRRLLVKFVPEENTAILALRTHDIDLFAIASETGYGEMKRLPGIATALTPIHGAANVLINNTKPQLQDIRVRRAIAYAIDKGAIVNQFIFGAGTVATADLPSFMWAYNPNVQTYAYDPKQSRALLQSAGYTAGSGGIMQRAGKPLSLVLAYSQQSATSRLVAATLQSYLRAAGIDTELKGYPGNLIYGSYAGGGIYQTGKFDLAIYTMTASLDPDASDRFTCAVVPPNGLNYSRYCNREMDAAQAGRLANLRSNRAKTCIRAQPSAAASRRSGGLSLLARRYRRLQPRAARGSIPTPSPKRGTRKTGTLNRNDIKFSGSECVEILFTAAR